MPWRDVTETACYLCDVHVSNGAQKTGKQRSKVKQQKLEQAPIEGPLYPG